jgi:choline kinase
MKVIILAAGIGQRISPLTDKVPKCLLTLGETTILRRIVDNCMHFGIEEFTAVIGHGDGAMIEAIDQLQCLFSIRFSYIRNPRYRTTNTAISLQIGLDNTKDDVMIINGDNVFDKEILRGLLNQSFTAVAIDNCKTLCDESFKVNIKGNRIELMGKDIPLVEANGEFIGISIIRKRDLELFKSILGKITRLNENSYYDYAFQELSLIQPISVVFTNGLKWTEVDTKHDLIIAQKLIKKIK